MRITRFIIIAGVAAAAQCAFAQTLYKLIDKNGKVTYSEEKPKEYDGQVIQLNIDPNANTATLPKANFSKPAPGTEGGVFNIGTAVETTILELAETMIDISGSKSTIKFVSQEAVYGSSYEDIPRRVPDTTRMETILGVRMETSLRDGLARTIEWFRAQQ